ncbi:Fur family transcriptional regulator [Vibrio sp. UCD-FRSSP16_10]|uniref:Fur family transcriptional regulator n=1 Tax=unclassified Vibrio TaxID=2614977 RepID=UPI0007FDE904|nr:MULTISPECIES: Fur family transcriptional regulator [unclassified Vibrio]OBT14005.1 Fur family transcriptional regulator [Vibrio sp. UCD-FRSSP16_30]OBT22886.1 Fur family transcriptional regulator [Vibrio sp. UCD-FRSSP16_10]
MPDIDQYSNTELIVEHATAKCKKNGGQLTVKRKQVLLCLTSSEKALSAYEVIDLYKEMFSENMSAMSVYRILDFLQEQGLVHRLQIANKYISCMHITCEHNHATAQFLICSKCFKVKEVSIDSAVIEELKQNVAKAGFVFASEQLEVNCLCEECKDL